MPGYSDHIGEHLRLALLKILLGAAGFRANDSVLTDASRQVGFSLPRDRVKTEIAWLAEQGLVTVEQLSHLQVVTLTQRGQDAAEGHATVPGVRRPSAS